MVHIEKTKANTKTACVPVSIISQVFFFQTRHKSILKLPLEKIMGFQKLNVKGVLEKKLYTSYMGSWYSNWKNCNMI